MVSENREEQNTLLMIGKLDTLAELCGKIIHPMIELVR